MGVLEGIPVPSLLWRVHKTEYGPLNPPLRQGPPNLTWGRFDIPRWVTLYGATTRLGAYAESLAGAGAPATALPAGLFDEPAESVEQQWQALGHMAPNAVARQWRDFRQITAFRRRLAAGVAVDVADSGTVAFLRSTVREWAPDGLEAKDVDLSLLTGKNRVVTSAIAWWLSHSETKTGELPVGLLYYSKHGVDIPCYALWVDLDRYGPGTSIQQAVMKEYEVVRRSEITQHDADLQQAADLHGVRIF